MSDEPKIILAILVAEDNPNDSELLSVAIRSAFPMSSIRVVNRLVDVLAALNESESFNLLLLDLSLPDTTGVSVVTAVRAVTDKPIIVITGDDQPETVAAVRREGADDCLIKSEYTPESLRYAIAGAIGHQEGHLLEPMRRELANAEREEAESIQRRKRIKECLLKTDATIQHLKKCVGLKTLNHGTQ